MVGCSGSMESPVSAANPGAARTIEARRAKHPQRLRSVVRVMMRGSRAIRLMARAMGRVLLYYHEDGPPRQPVGYGIPRRFHAVRKTPIRARPALRPGPSLGPGLRFRLGPPPSRRPPDGGAAEAEPGRSQEGLL